MKTAKQLLQEFLPAITKKGKQKKLQIGVTKALAQGQHYKAAALQNRLADRVGIHGDRLSPVEKGKAHLKITKKIEKKLSRLKGSAY